MFSIIFTFFDSKKVFQLFFVDIPRCPLKEKSFWLAIGKFSQFIRFLWAIINLPSQTASIGEHKINIVAVFHDTFDQLLELILVFRRKDVLAIVKDYQDVSFIKFFDYFLCIFLESFVELYLWALKKLHADGFKYFKHFFTRSDVKVDNPIFKYISNLYISD